MPARITQPHRTTQTLAPAQAAAASQRASETHSDLYGQAVAEADALAAEMFDERPSSTAQTRSRARPTTPVVAVRAPQRTTVSRPAELPRVSFFASARGSMPSPMTRGERVTQVAQQLQVEAALVERAASELEAKEMPTDTANLALRTRRVQLIVQVARQIDADAGTIERAAVELENENYELTAFVLRQRGQRVRYEERVQEYNARSRAVAAERGEYGLEQISTPSAADATPEAARERLRRDSERYDFILRPAG